MSRRLGTVCALIALVWLLPVLAHAVVFGPRLQRHLGGLAAAPATTVAQVPVMLRLLAEGPEVGAFARRLQAYGVDVRRFPGFVRLDVPVAQLARLSGDEDVLVDTGRRLYPMLDRAAAAIGLNDAIRSERDGRDVLIAVLDTGTDFTHPDFRNDDGSTRFVAYWDQTADNDNPELFGVVCDAVDINRVLLQDDIDACPNRADEPLGGFLPSGHGTHVAGIAAGADDVYRGMAPGAMLVGIRLTFEEAGLVDAITWSADVAETFNKPVVINLSLGANDAGHDGYAPSEVAIDDISGPGVVVVAAAGNERSLPIHVGAPAASATRRSRFGTVGAFRPAIFHLEAWADDADGLEVALAIEDEDGNIAAETPFFEHNNLEPFTTHPLKRGDTHVADVMGLALTTPAGGGVRFEVTAVDGSLSGQDFQLLWRSPQGRFDAWLTDRVAAFDETSGPTEIAYSDGMTEVARFFAGDVLQTITLPGTARESITVTGFVTRKQWPTVAGETAQSTSDSELGELLDIASIGPTRDGRIKPDIAAPGEFIVSSFATTIDDDFVADLQRADETHWVQRGTSMASPHIAGVAALLLQENRDLDADALRAVFAQLAVTDGETGSVPNTRWGDGKLLLDGIKQTDAWQNQNRDDTQPPQIAGLQIRRNDGRVTLTWTTDELARAEVVGGDRTYTVDSFGLRHELVVQGNLPDNFKVTAVDPRDNASAAKAITVPGRGCGCHSAGGSGPWLPLLLAVVGWVLLRHPVGPQPAPVRHRRASITYKTHG